VHLAEIWQEHGQDPGFNQPPRSLVELVEELTGETATFGDTDD